MKRTKQYYSIMIVESSGFTDSIADGVTTIKEAMKLARQYSTPGDMLVIRRWNVWPADYHTDFVRLRHNKTLCRVPADLEYWTSKLASR